MQVDAWGGRSLGARAEPLPRARTLPGAACARPSACGVAGGATLLTERLEDALGDRGRDRTALALLAIDDHGHGDLPGEADEPEVVDAAGDVDLGRAGLAGQF